jgi:hypothetical protein
MKLELTRPTCPPGSSLSGQIEAPPGALARLEVYWERIILNGARATMIVVEQEREVPSDGRLSFDLPLPLLPLSFDGELFSLSWGLDVYIGEHLLSRTFTRSSAP